MQLRMRRKDVGLPVDERPVATNLNDLRVLYDLHGAEIFRFCHRIVDDRGLAEEATQETFLRAWKSRDRWDGGVASVRTWLFSIARNVCIDLLRARNIRPSLSKSQDGDGPDGQGFDDPAYDAFLEGSMLEEGLRRIKEDQRHAIVETYLKGRPYPEVAKELGVPEATLRTRVFYGLKALRRALEEMGWNG
jgi:RNA polymerase sigma-70 factor, ECF subfamily